jgi:hypothetical protein
MSPRVVLKRFVRRLFSRGNAPTKPMPQAGSEPNLRIGTREANEPRLVCIGHSHTRTVVAAARRQGVSLAGIDFWSTGAPLVMDEGRPRFRQDIAQQLSGIVFSMVGGTAFNIMALCVHPRRFDFVLPSAPQLPFDPLAELVPFGAVRSALLAMTQDYLNLMGYVRDAARGPVYHVEAPPPFADAVRKLPREFLPYFADKSREISPHYFRYKMWRLHSEIVQDFCARRSIGFIPRPPEAVDSEGFLLPRYYADPMHVNEAYGALVLAQMRRLA